MSLKSDLSLYKGYKMDKVKYKLVNGTVMKVPQRYWTNYTIVDYIDALGKDFELAMKIREELYTGISKALPITKPKG